MRLYLSGPMRGRPDNNSSVFRAAAAMLRSRGHEVWSPSEHDESHPESDLKKILARDLDAVILWSEGVALLRGWELSHGACLERHAAEVVGIPCFEVDPLDVADGLRPVMARDWRVRRPGVTDPDAE